MAEVVCLLSVIAVICDRRAPLRPFIVHVIGAGADDKMPNLMRRQRRSALDSMGESFNEKQNALLLHATDRCDA